MRHPIRRVCCVLALVAAPSQAQAAVFEVNNNADSGPGSLRAAITALNAHPDPDAQHDIVFRLPAAQAGILVPSELPAIDQRFVRVLGQPALNPGARPNLVRFGTTRGPLLRLGARVEEAEISQLGLSNGAPCIDASAPAVTATLLFDGLRLTGCGDGYGAGAEVAGGAMRLRGRAVVANSEFQGNFLTLEAAPGALRGADIALLAGTLDLIDSRLESARMLHEDATPAVSCWGGSVHGAVGTTMRIVDTEISDALAECGLNSAGGAIASEGRLSLDRVRLRQNIAPVGGAVWFGPSLDATATLRVQNTLFLDNQAWDYLATDPDGIGGGLFVSPRSGVPARVEMRNVTFALNRARGGRGAHIADSGADYRQFHSVLLGATGPRQNGSPGEACALATASAVPATPSASLAPDASCAAFAGIEQRDAAALGLQIVEPVNSPPLGVALADGSPAIDRGAAGAPSASDFTRCAPQDLDGNARPFDGDGDGTAACDIGAIEAGADRLFASGFEPG